jgi:post-segregation antitoxin (ccd killing protein)
MTTEIDVVSVTAEVRLIQDAEQARDSRLSMSACDPSGIAKLLRKAQAS